jgi:PKD repeat protein
MRSIPLMAATTVIVALASACGDGGGGLGNPPVATFTPPSCTAGTPCQFTDASTPAGEITAWSWNFGDANAPTADQTSTLQNPLHTYSQPGPYTVQLTVTSPGGTNTTSNTVTVTGTANQPPTATFDLPTSCTAGTPCGFHSTSTDPDGDIALATFAWNFGDPTSASNTADTPDATHTFAAAGTYTVTLTVTDEDGAASTPATQQLTVSPAASQSCTTSGITVDCLLTITQTGQVKITLQSSDCELGDNKLSITAPRAQDAINNVCFQPDNTVFVVKDQNQQPLVFQAGSQLGIRFRQGAPDPGDPATGDPGIRVVGSFPNLTLNVDDGGNAAAQGEPDFNDAVLLVQQGP